MSTATTLALSALLPHLTPSALPPRLIDTADSLVALSRQRAPTLKRDEEIARAHACAEIACGRLREKLRLPPVKTGTAPASKRAYAKLLRFLEEVLGREPVVVEEAARVGKRKRGEDEEREDGEGSTRKKKKKQQQQQQQSPTATTSSARRAATTMVVASTTLTKSKSKQKSNKGNAAAAADIHVPTNDPSEAPSLVLPLVRELCAHFRTPSMAHHVYIGCIIALTRSGLWPRATDNNNDDNDDDHDTFERNVQGLVMAVWMMVLTRMMKGRMEKALFHEVTGRMVRIAGWTKTTMTTTTTTTAPTTATDDQGATKREKEVEGWVKKVDKSGWTRGQEWWEEVPMGCWEFSLQDGHGQLDGVAAAEEKGDTDAAAAAADDDDDDELGDEEKGRREDLNLDPDLEGVLLPGLGTMMQDAVDWLSDERTREFKVWKADTLQKIEQIMAQGKRSGTVAAVH